MSGNPFDVVNAVSFSKKPEVYTDDPSAYVPFIINRSLSYFPDTVLYANEMNRLAGLDTLLQFSYLINIIRPRRRFSKWAKRQDDENLELVKSYYGMNNTRARQALEVLTADQLITMKQKTETGGVKQNELGSRKSGRDKAKGTKRLSKGKRDADPDRGGVEEREEALSVLPYTT